MERNLTKSEIIKLFYGDERLVLEPDYQWKTNIEALGLNPEHFVLELETNEVVNIYELYAELVFCESDALKESLTTLKKNRFGTRKHEYIITPVEYDFFGEPKDRNEYYYLSRLLKTDWANAKAFEFARVFSQGDARQPLKTEEMIHLYSQNEHTKAADEETLRRLIEADISLLEWERAMIIKDLLYLQLKLVEDIEHHSELFITELMPKKYMYGQTIIYSPNKKSFSINGEWKDLKSI